MVVEYIRYRVGEGREREFERSYAEASEALDVSPNCLAYEVSRCAEEPTVFVVRIEWDSAEGHLEGFRRSPDFRRFLQAVRPFFDYIEEMRHYERTGVVSAGSG